MLPDLILHNAKIFTVDQNLPWATAVAITGGYITAIGSDPEILAHARPNTTIMDLGGRLMLPGLCDAHIHFYDWSLSGQQIMLANCDNKEEMLNRIRKGSALARESRWLIGRGWNESYWAHPAFPTRVDLDQATGSQRPAIFWRSDMHAAVANSAALSSVGITSSTDDPDGGIIGRDTDGHPNGLLWELAINLVSQHVPTPTTVELEQAMLEAMVELHRLGVTAIHDQRMKDQTEGPLALSAYQRLLLGDRLKLRVNCNIAAHDLPHITSLGLRTGFGNEYLRLGHVKLFADGTMGSQTAWMLDPYQKANVNDLGFFGVSLTPPAQMAAEIKKATETGFPVSIHAIGDRANREVLDIFEEINEHSPPLPIPHRIEHVQIIDPIDLPRLAALNLTASVQPIHALDDMDIAGQVMGIRANRVYNFGSLLKHGTRLALGSDAPVADPNPFLGFHAAIYRQRPENMSSGPWYGDQALTLEQVISGYTRSAAESAGWGNSIGSISVGKRADLIVLDRDLFSFVKDGVSGKELVETQVLMTVFDGEIVFQRS